jgi:hypothetical protein
VSELTDQRTGRGQDRPATGRSRPGPRR